MKRYSFIVPVYNCKNYLPDCVRSIRAMALDSCEILLVDDGSTDGSGGLCDGLAAQYPGVRVIHQNNSGASAARNRGIREATGDKIVFIDADDSIEPELLRGILTDPRCDQADMVIFGLTFDYYRKGNCYRRDPLFYAYDSILLRQDWADAFAELYAQNSLSPVWNKVFRRDILIQNKLELNEDMFLYEDFEFVLRYMQHCDRIWNVPRAVYHYRQSEDEGNAKRRLARIDSIPAFLQPIEEALSGLLHHNPAVSPEQKARILQQLHLVLAREKVSVSTLTEIKKICREFNRWTEARDLPLEATKFQRWLQEEKALQLWLADKKTALRHRIAVWVKSHLYRI